MSFSVVEAAMARLHNIASEKRIAFQGRIKAYLKQGLLEGAAQGRGRAVSYPPASVALIGVTLELTQLGLPPERAVTASKRNQPLIAFALNEAIRRPNGDDWYLHCDPHALAPLGDSPEEEGSFFAGPRAALAPKGRSNRRVASINLSILIDDLVAALPTASREAFMAGLKNWADSTRREAAPKPSGFIDPADL